MLEKPDKAKEISEKVKERAKAIQYGEIIFFIKAKIHNGEVTGGEILEEKIKLC